MTLYISVRMTDEQFIATAGGGILYDASRLSKPRAELFSRSSWATRGALEEISAPGGAHSQSDDDDPHGVVAPTTEAEGVPGVLHFTDDEPS